MAKTQWVHLTIAAKIAAAADEEKPSALTTHVVPEDSELFINLAGAIRQASDPRQRFLIDTYQPVFFNLKAKVIVNPRHQPVTVLGAVEDTLKTAFTSEQRAFSQAVTAAEVVSPGFAGGDLGKF